LAEELDKFFRFMIWNDVTGEEEEEEEEASFSEEACYGPLRRI
jgi:hypothetical protein